jgi:hypothetical protein
LSQVLLVHARLTDASRVSQTVEVVGRTLPESQALVEAQLPEILEADVDRFEIASLGPGGEPTRADYTREDTRLRSGPLRRR